MIRTDINKLNINPFEIFSRGRVLLTAGEKPNSMTIAWGAMGTLFSQNICIVFVKESRFTNHLMQESKYFTLSFLSEKYKKELGIMGTKSGKDTDKYELTGLTPVFDNDKFCSYIKESDMVIKLEKISELKFDYASLFSDEAVKKYYSGSDLNNFHHVYFGKIVSTLVNEDFDITKK